MISFSINIRIEVVDTKSNGLIKEMLRILLII